MCADKLKLLNLMFVEIWCIKFVKVVLPFVYYENVNENKKIVCIFFFHREYKLEKFWNQWYSVNWYKWYLLI